MKEDYRLLQHIRSRSSSFDQFAARRISKSVGSAGKKFLRLFLTCLALVCGSSAALANLQDENANRGTNRNTTRNTKSTRKSAKPPAVPPRSLVSIKVRPQDSTVVLDGQQLDLDSGGELHLTGLRIGRHSITVSHTGYTEHQQTIELQPGENDPIDITLTSLKGTLNVVPGVTDADINIRSIDRNQNVGTYVSAISSLELPPGAYEITISKKGYEIVTRKVSIKPAESVYLEPQLSPLPPPAPAPKPAISVLPMNSLVEKQGKYFIVYLQGASGDTSKTLGSINVTVAEIAGNNVRGVLNGLPCRVQFVQLENVAEGALVETPGPSNQWARVVVRVRPKDSKRPIVFAINWSSLQDSSSPLPVSPPDGLVDAVATERVLPSFPAAARNSPVAGTVNVSVTIDSRGSVISAKAIDGPNAFRHAAEEAARKWKFRPATRNGQAIESVQILRFVFDR